jgi:pyruvate/2-oxoglutarate dehydrogenase complex dihydrolipoamide acyltransferase (E2) component
VPESRRVPVRLPKWGLTTDDAVVVEWMVSEGERVELGSVLLTVETDKTVAQVEAPVSGRLVAIAVQDGESVQPGDVLAEIETE